MGDAADELAHCFDLLRLQERRLRPLALLAFGPEEVVRLFQSRSALGDQTLQFFGGASLRFQIGASFVLAGSAALRHQDGRLQRDGLHRPLEKRDVSKSTNQLATELVEPRTFVVIGEHDERHVRPGRLC